MPTNNPKVIIQCLVYNHEPYLRQCLNGFVMQKTDFQFYALVHDDASTDHSASIIREYANQHPDIIKPIFDKENQYSKHDGALYRMMWEASKDAKYIAVCEGDDYWTDPLKLQKQVDFMESHPDFAICFHSVKVLDENTGQMTDDNLKDVPEVTDIYDLATGNYMHTVSVLYRASAYKPEIQSKIGGIVVDDYSVWMPLALSGKIFKMKEQMAVYRFGQGVWAEGLKCSVQWLTALNRIRMVMLDKKVVSVLDESICREEEYLYKELRRLENIESSRAYRIGKAVLKPFSWLHKK